MIRLDSSCLRSLFGTSRGLHPTQVGGSPFEHSPSGSVGLGRSYVACLGRIPCTMIPGRSVVKTGKLTCRLDLADCFADESVPATPYIQSGTGWITQAKARMFIHGCNRPTNEVHAQAYRALRAPNVVEPHLGMDRSLGSVKSTTSVHSR